MHYITKFTLFISLLFTAGLSFADCSYKIVNHTATSFEELNASATTGNLLIPLCKFNPNTDAATLANCAEDPQNTLFAHPHYEATCQSVSRSPINLRIAATHQHCTSHSLAGSGHTVMNYPEDFSCN